NPTPNTQHATPNTQQPTPLDLPMLSETSATVPRWKTRAVRVGPHFIGGSHPILVQSMITEDTRDVPACVAAVLRLAEAGCELVRVTAPSMRDAEAIAQIQAELQRRGATVPLVADVHHEGTRIAEEVARHVDKVRI